MKKGTHDNSNIAFLDAILTSLAKASGYNRNDMVAPAVVLWTDKDRQWEPLADRLRVPLKNVEQSLSSASAYSG